MNREIVSLVVKHTKDAGVDPTLALGIIQTESGGDAYAVRYEQNYRWTLPQAKRPATCSQNTETAMQKTSWGLMQIMGAVAREHGFDGWLPSLIDPDTNIALGVAHLKKLSQRFEDKYGLDGVIAAYNAGSPRLENSGKYINQKYVDTVKKRMGEMEALLAEEAPSATGAPKTQASKKNSSLKAAELPGGEAEQAKEAEK